ncbi:hypothetical protein C8J56DRAFT_1040255 [Mycena floridula]|nr:hypothetical protein C8J56DRAFT_1040255 [Mycena floridula]
MRFTQSFVLAFLAATVASLPLNPYPESGAHSIGHAILNERRQLGVGNPVPDAVNTAAGAVGSAANAVGALPPIPAVPAALPAAVPNSAGVQCGTTPVVAPPVTPCDTCGGSDDSTPVVVPPSPPTQPCYACSGHDGLLLKGLLDALKLNPTVKDAIVNLGLAPLVTKTLGLSL